MKLVAFLVLIAAGAVHANDFKPYCTLSYVKADYPGTLRYETVCIYGQNLVQEMVTATISETGTSPAALLSDCESQCQALAKAHPNGF